MTTSREQVARSADSAPTPRTGTPAWWVQSRGRSLTITLLLVAAAFAVLGTLTGGTTSEDSTDLLPQGFDSTEVAQRLPDVVGGDTATGIAVVSREGEALTQEDIAFLREVGAAWSQEGVTVAPPEPIVSEDGTAAILTAEIDSAGGPEALPNRVEDLREILKEDVPDGLEVGMTGPAAISADISQVFDGANVTLLAATASVVAFLLIITYRSPVLWLIPLLTVAVADRVAAIVGSQVAQLTGIPLDGSAEGILSVLVFGAGTDYALLLIARYREELVLHEDRRVAMTRAVQGVTEPILSSSFTVILALLTLLLSVVPSTRGLGLSSAVGISIAVVAGLFVLPGILVLFGRWVFWPRVPRFDPDARETGDEEVVRTTVWGRVGTAVTKRPGSFLAVTLGGLLLLSSGALGASVGLNANETFLDTPESLTVSERLAESFPAGASQPIAVLTPTQSVPEVQAALEDVESVAQVQPAGENDGTTALNVVITPAPGSDAADQAIRDIRDALEPVGDDVLVGGRQVQDFDSSAAAARDLKLIVPLILIAVGGVLLVLLRSVVATAVLLASVVLTWVSALGLSWWIFTGPLGQPAFDRAVPLYSFLFLVALGVDFTIFLVTRAKEEVPKHGTVKAMVVALARTGGVITSAGILLAAVFLTLGVLPLLALAQIGTIVCIGVLLDTLVVRTMVVPAATALLGDRFWWPSAPPGTEPEPEREEALSGTR